MQLHDSFRGYFSSREEVNIETKRLFISRNSPTNCGKSRVLLNETEILTMLNQKSFQSIKFEELSLKEKYKLASNAQIVVSPIGANITNFYFSKNSNIELFLIIVGENITCDFIYFRVNQLSILGKIDVNKIKVIKGEFEEIESLDPSNKPFRVNVNRVKELIFDLV
jgi:hypothetical protein